MYIDPRFTKSIGESSSATTEIRRHLNGSIDLGHYVRIGREAHGATVRDGGRLFAGIFRRFFGGLSPRRGAPAE
jgi:hypothetical protein